MSELTRCNYCTLRSIKSRAASQDQSVLLAQTMLDGREWITVSVDGHRVASFLSLTDHCVC